MLLTESLLKNETKKYKNLKNIFHFFNILKKELKVIYFVNIINESFKFDENYKVDE